MGTFHVNMRSCNFFLHEIFKMVSQWRAAGLSYLQYSAICARLVRRCLKPEFRADIARFDESTIKAVKWENGKQVGEPKKINVGQ